MSLNIKNDETCRLARELAQLTRESMTGAITAALRERLERETRARSVETRLKSYARHRKALREGSPARTFGGGARRSAL